jgi:hypothetical protein
VQNNVLAVAISFSEARNHKYTRRVGDLTHVFTGQKLLLLIIREQLRHKLSRDLAHVEAVTI